MKLQSLLESNKPYYDWGSGSITWERKGGDLTGAPQLVKNFTCSYSQLDSLIGGPKIVDDLFSCIDNNITNFIGAPEKTFKFDVCDCDKLSSFEGITPIIENRLLISNCKKLISLMDIANHLKSVRYLEFRDQQFLTGGLGLLLIDNLEFVILTERKISFDEYFKEAIEIINKYLEFSNRKSLIYECQKELINAGLEDYAQI